MEGAANPARGEGLQDDEAPATAVAKVTLNDCLACAGCITSAETVLVTAQSVEEFSRMLSAAPAAYDLVAGRHIYMKYIYMK